MLYINLSNGCIVQLVPPTLDRIELSTKYTSRWALQKVMAAQLLTKANVTHLGKLDCRRDSWVNKLHKHKETVSTRQKEVTASAWLADIHQSLTVRRDAVEYCMRTDETVSSCTGCALGFHSSCQMQQMYRQDYKADMQAGCGWHDECRMKCLIDVNDPKLQA